MSEIRGKKVMRTLTLFGEETETIDEERPKGRNPELYAGWKELVLARVVYYRMNGMVKDEWIFKQIKCEFFISESTIGQLIEDNGDIMMRLRKGISLKMLREKYYWIEWEKHPGIG